MEDKLFSKSLRNIKKTPPPCVLYPQIYGLERGKGSSLLKIASLRQIVDHRQDFLLAVVDLSSLTSVNPSFHGEQTPIPDYL